MVEKTINRIDRNVKELKNEVGGGGVTEDWTCEQCIDGVAGSSNYMTSSTESQANYLLDNGICSEMPDQTLCLNVFSNFYAIVGPMLWRGHFSYLCHDKLSECGEIPHNYYGNLTTSQNPTFPSCNKCKIRVNAHLTSLATDEVIAAWVNGDWYPCTLFSSQSECTSFIQGIMGKIITSLVEWKSGTENGSMASEWCSAWGAC